MRSKDEHLSPEEIESILSAPDGTYSQATVDIAKQTKRNRPMTWKVLQSSTPIEESQLSQLASEGWTLRLCVPFGGALYWYFEGAN